MNDGEVKITFGVVPCNGGWIPEVRANGRRVLSAWTHPLDKDDAARCARATAEEEASRYRGEWQISLLEIQGFEAA